MTVSMLAIIWLELPWNPLNTGLPLCSANGLLEWTDRLSERVGSSRPHWLVFDYCFLVEVPVLWLKKSTITCWGLLLLTLRMKKGSLTLSPTRFLLRFARHKCSFTMRLQFAKTPCVSIGIAPCVSIDKAPCASIGHKISSSEKVQPTGKTDKIIWRPYKLSATDVGGPTFATNGDVGKVSNHHSSKWRVMFTVGGMSTGGKIKVLRLLGHHRTFCGL